jgi:hypothetical protein
VLGGLIRETEDVQVNKVPLLGDIPVLGWLFKSKSIEKNKQNLVMFITPKIIRNTMDGQDLVRKRMDERIDFIKDHMGGKDPHGSRAMNIYGGKEQNFQEVSPAENEVFEDLEPDLDSTTDEIPGLEEPIEETEELEEIIE